MFFIKEYKPKKIKKSNLRKVRLKIFNKINKNLLFLLNKRFLWMKNLIKNKKIIIELGSGNGCIYKVLKENKIILTDIVKHPWIDKKIDMTNVNLGKKYLNKVDVFIINHSLHHCPNPSRSLKRMSKYLKRGGLILMNEPETSFVLKFLQILLDDEGWSYKKDVFNDKKNIFKQSSPWNSNTAIANILFRNEKKFRKYFPQYEINKNELSEFFIFINSSGVNNNILYIPMNNFFLSLFSYIDKFLIFLFPAFFALNRSVILKKI